MKDFAIKATNVSKQYRLGQVGTGTLKNDLNRLWHQLRGKEDPYLKIGQENDRTRKTEQDYVWALQDINFEVKQGEVLGIIGRNGAGKSTLLKILSKITAPTTGEIEINGRIASLLEVGTGFHPELTGRENIYLNGAILGMRKYEIQQKFDAIVDFSGVAAYIDTPVKRYSSGMYVRLAFAVAAFLEPEILVVDEVLAVGDAEFQRKCLGRMKDVSQNDGRTVLFVSHNMTAIKSLCTSALLLNNGNVELEGDPEFVIQSYISKEFKSRLDVTYEEPALAPGNDLFRLKKCQLHLRDDQERSVIDVNAAFLIEFEIWCSLQGQELNLSLHFFNIEGNLIFNVVTDTVHFQGPILKGVAEVPGKLLNDGYYYINIMVVRGATTPLYTFEHCLEFAIADARTHKVWHGKWPGLIRPANVSFKIMS